MSTTDGVSLCPLHADFGVEVGGLDLRGALAPATIDLLDQELRRHRLVVIRDQELDESAQLRVAAALGVLVASRTSAPGRRPVPEIRYEADSGVAARNEQPFYNEQWHADLSWSRQGAPVTLLYAVEADPGCATTEFADMVSAYESLDDATRATIEAWQAFHHVARSRELRYGQPPSAPRRAPRRDTDADHRRRRFATVARRRISKALRQWARVIADARQPDPRFRAVPPEGVELPGALHPVVQTDPVSGRRFVHLGDHVWTLAGEDDVEGPAMVDGLNRRIVADDNVHPHRWSPGDLVVFDNRSVLHRRSPDGEDTAHRVLRRCVVWRPPPPVLGADSFTS